MNQSNSLFQLIHSLSRNEKRYFTVVAATHRDSSIYLKLFKAIDLQENYDEKAIKDQFGHEPFIKYFSVIKVQLYHFLLKILRSFNEGRTIDFQLKEMMMDAAILNEKALYQESRHKLQSAKQLAQEHEDWKVLLEILHREYTIVSLTAETRMLEKELKAINADEKTIIAQLNNYAELAYLAISLNMMLKMHHSVQDKSKVKSIEEVISNPALKNEEKALSFRAKSLFYYIWSSYLIGTHQFGKAEQYLLKHIKLYEHHKHFMQAAPGNYLGALRDLLISRFRIGHYGEVLKMIEQLKKLPDSNLIKRITTRRFRMVIFSWTFKVEVGIAIQTKTVQQQLTSIQEHETLFQRQSGMMERGTRQETLLALAAFYYFVPNHKKSVQLVEKLIGDDASGVDHKAATLARMLQMIIHFEEGNYDVLDYLATGLKRFAKQQALTKTEKMLVEFAGKLARFHRIKNKREFFSTYLKKLSELKKDRFEKDNFDYFDMTEWLKKKMIRS